MRFINKFKIPTILGLTVIVAGIVGGVFLVVKDRSFFTKASADFTPKNITISNITDTETTISWETPNPITSFITFGQKEPLSETVLDDRDINKPSKRTLHYTTIKNLQPETNYVFKITSGNVTTDTKVFKTSATATFQNGFGPIIGTVFKGGEPQEEGVVYLSISDATIQSSLIKNLGNFLIPISLMRKGDLSDTFQPVEEAIGKLTIIGINGKSNVSFKIRASGTELPPVTLGQNIDLTFPENQDSEIETSELDKFDLNGDRQINAIDYSEVLLNFGKNSKNANADINKDGVVDNIDLGEIANRLGIIIQ